MLVYHVTELEGTNPRAGRTYIRNHGAFYMKSGKDFHSKGQTTLVVDPGGFAVGRRAPARGA
jgi:hypothetical protein